MIMMENAIWLLVHQLFDIVLAHIVLDCWMEDTNLSIGVQQTKNVTECLRIKGSTW